MTIKYNVPRTETKELVKTISTCSAARQNTAGTYLFL